MIKMDGKTDLADIIRKTELIQEPEKSDTVVFAASHQDHKHMEELERRI